MTEQTRRPVPAIGLGLAIGCLAGGVAGLTKGCSETRSIAKQMRANGRLVDGTGFPIIALGFCLIGALLGIAIGGAIGSVVRYVRGY